MADLCKIKCNNPVGSSLSSMFPLIYHPGAYGGYKHYLAFNTDDGFMDNVYICPWEYSWFDINDFEPDMKIWIPEIHNPRGYTFDDVDIWKKESPRGIRIADEYTYRNGFREFVDHIYVPWDRVK